MPDIDLRPARRSPARSRTPSAATIIVDKVTVPAATRRTSPSTPAGGRLRPRTSRSTTRAPRTTAAPWSRPAPTRSARPCPPAGTSTSATCIGRQPRRRHRPRRRRDRHLHLHEPQARPHRRRQGRVPAATRSFTSSRRRRLPTTSRSTDASDAARQRRPRPGQHLLGRRDRADRLGPHVRRPARDGSPVEPPIDLAGR